MKRILLGLLIILNVAMAQAQIVPGDFTSLAKPFLKTGTGLDARSQFLDKTVSPSKTRDYISVAEALTYLSNSNSTVQGLIRSGGFELFINSTGTLSGGVISGGARVIYWFKDGVTNSDLVVKSGGSTLDTTSISNRINLKAPLTGGGASGTWGIGITGSAAQLNGQGASYYLNYNNFTNTPVYGRGLSNVSGTIKLDTAKNYTIGASGGVTKVISDTLRAPILKSIATVPEINLTNSQDNTKVTLKRFLTDNKLVLRGSTKAVAGPGNALAFNYAGGTNQYFIGADTNIPSGILPSYTINFVVRFNTLGGPLPLLHFGANASNDICFGLFGSTLYFTKNGAGSGSDAIGQPPFVEGQWYIITLVANGSSPMVAYINNSQYTINNGFTGDFTSNGTLNNFNYNTGSYYPKITINQIAIWNRALTRSSGSGGTDEIAQVYAGGVGTTSLPASGLVRSLQFQDGTGNMVTDAIGGYNLTTFNNPSYIGVGNGIVPQGSVSLDEDILSVTDGVGASASNRLFWGGSASEPFLSGVRWGYRASNNNFVVTGSAKGIKINPANTSSTAEPEANLELGPGTALQPPFMIPPGPLSTTLKEGAVENDGIHITVVIGGVRYQLDGGGGAPTGLDGQIVSYHDSGVPIAIGRLSMQNAKQIFTPSTGGTVTALNNGFSIINPSGTLAALTIALPTTPQDGDVVHFKSTQALTAITYTGGTVIGGPSSVGPGFEWNLVYDLATLSWY